MGALARSPQQWSSYSGYLRDLVTVCFAYRRFHDIDLAKALYQNASSSMQDFIVDLRKFEQSKQGDEMEIRKRRDDMMQAMDDLANTLAQRLAVRNQFDFYLAADGKFRTLKARQRAFPLF